jgi:hypothetical protein
MVRLRLAIARHRRRRGSARHRRSGSDRLRRVGLARRHRLPAGVDRRRHLVEFDL